MLDQQILEQLKTVYQPLEGQIELSLKSSTHSKHKELEQMLTEIASTSSKITLVNLDESSEAPEFYLKYNGQKNGISFVGIPGGHEFTSLILSILNSDGKGKLPDEMILQKIKALKGPINLKTFISLSCENCPEVVQALNIMAINNPEIEHQMVDGEFREEDIKRLNVQGVPSVIGGQKGKEKLISSGKVNLLELITRLEKEYGSNAQEIVKDLGHYDAIVIGAGPAGASSAIYLARKGLKTAIIAEKMGGQVQDTKGIENLISVTYTEGPQLTAKMAEHIAAYEIDLLEHRRVKSLEVIDGNKSHLKLNTGETASASKLIIATGAKWKELNVPGEKEYLGRGVAFCPHCDGPYYKGKDIAVIGGGNSGVEAAIDLAGIVKSVTVFEFGEKLKADNVLIEKMNSTNNINVITNARTTEILGDGSKVNEIEYEDRSSKQNHKIKLDGVFVQIGLLPNSQFIKGLVDTNDYGEIIIDDKCRTNIKGVYAAGDVTTVPFKQIVVAMGEGSKAALTAFEDIMMS